MFFSHLYYIDNYFWLSIFVVSIFNENIKFFGLWTWNIWVSENMSHDQIKPACNSNPIIPRVCLIRLEFGENHSKIMCPNSLIWNPGNGKIFHVNVDNTSCDQLYLFLCFSPETYIALHHKWHVKFLFIQICLVPKQDISHKLLSFPAIAWPQFQCRCKDNPFRL